MSNAIPPTPGPASRRATPAMSMNEENPHEKLVPVYIEPKVTFLKPFPWLDFYSFDVGSLFNFRLKAGAGLSGSIVLALGLFYPP